MHIFYVFRWHQKRSGERNGRFSSIFARSYSLYFHLSLMFTWENHDTYGCFTEVRLLPSIWRPILILVYISVFLSCIVFILLYLVYVDMCNFVTRAKKKDRADNYCQDLHYNEVPGVIEIRDAHHNVRMFLSCLFEVLVCVCGRHNGRYVLVVFQNKCLHHSEQIFCRGICSVCNKWMSWHGTCTL